MLVTFRDVPGVDRDVQVARTGVKIDGAAPSVTMPPPQLGEHTAELLVELGFTDGEVAALRKANAI